MYWFLCGQMFSILLGNFNLLRKYQNSFQSTYIILQSYSAAYEDSNFSISSTNTCYCLFNLGILVGMK